MTFNKSTVYFCIRVAPIIHFPTKIFFSLKQLPLVESTMSAFLNYYSLYKSHKKPIWINETTLLYLEYKMRCKFRVEVTRRMRTIHLSGF